MSDNTSRDGGLGEGFVSVCRQQLAESGQTVRHCLDQLDDEQIWRRPREEMNSIGNLLLHLTGNLRQRIVSVVGGEPDVRDRFREFTEQGPIAKESLRRGFDEILARADTVLANMAVTRLHDAPSHARIAGTKGDTIQAVIFRTLTHLAGHTQEIIHLTRAQLGERYAFKEPSLVPPSMRQGSR